MDKFSVAQRSRIMASVRSKNTAPERFVRSVAHALGFRFRLHRRDLPGSPDLVFPRMRKVIFVHGCFWEPGITPCVKTLRGITAPGILGSTVTRRAKNAKICLPLGITTKSDFVFTRRRSEAAIWLASVFRNKDRVSPDCRCYDHPSTWMASEPSYSSLPTTVTKDVYRDFWKIKCSTV